MKFKFFYQLSFLFYFLVSCANHDSSAYEDVSSVNSGDLNNTFVEDSPPPEPILSPEELLQKEKKKLIDEGWSDKRAENGQLPTCYNFKPKYEKSIDNYLEVQVGNGSDVAVKVMEHQTDGCVRYVFINSGSTYRIANIPEGQYYLKIGYGKDWISRVDKNQCVGKFLRNPIYEKSSELMDFNIQHHGNSYSVPYFQLNLDVITSDGANTFNSNKINESEFNI